MAVHVEMLTAGAAKASDTRPDIPQYSQAQGLVDNFNFDDGPNMRWTWNSQFFQLQATNAGATVEVTQFAGLQFSPNNDFGAWLMFNTWLLAWMNLLPKDQVAQIGILNIQPNSGLIHCMTNASLNPTNRGEGFGAYALIAQATSTPGISDLWLALLRFGQTNLSRTGGGIPTRTNLLNCGTVTTGFDNGGVRLSLQSLWKEDHWELAAYCWQGYFFFPNEPAWEFRGSINDAQLKTGVPGFGVANFQLTGGGGSVNAINMDDWNGGWEQHPWPWPLTAPLSIKDHPDAGYVIRKAYSAEHGQLPVFPPGGTP